MLRADINDNIIIKDPVGDLFAWRAQHVISLRRWKRQQAGGKFQSLSEPWADTTMHAGKMIMTIFAGIAESL
jgi:hypothetical protein